VVLILAHQGGKAYSESFDLVYRREASKPNAIWQADHAQLDILLLRDDGATARPWLTVVIDDYSRAVSGYYLGFVPPSSIRTSLALRQGIWRKSHPHWHIAEFLKSSIPITALISRRSTWNRSLPTSK
jgi:putative transposase